jgi:hypothetical protein
MKAFTTIGTILLAVMLGISKPMGQQGEAPAAPQIGDTVIYVMPDGTPRPAIILVAEQDQRCRLTIFLRHEDDNTQPPISGPPAINGATRAPLIQIDSVPRDDFRSVGTWHFAESDGQTARRKGPRHIPTPVG